MCLKLEPGWRWGLEGREGWHKQFQAFTGRRGGRKVLPWDLRPWELGSRTLPGYPLKNCIFKFPVFSLSDRKFSLCQFTWFVTCTYTKLTWQTYPASKILGKFPWQILKHLLPLESGNLELEQNKFSVFSLWFCKISLTIIFFGHFPGFPCAVRTLRYRPVIFLFLQIPPPPSLQVNNVQSLSWVRLIPPCQWTRWITRTISLLGTGLVCRNKVLFRSIPWPLSL